MNIGDILCLSGAGSSPTDAFVKGYLKAPMAALVRADFQKIWLCCSVKSSPMKVVESVVEFADDRGHGGHPIVFILEQPIDSQADFFMHEDSVLRIVFESLMAPFEMILP